MWEKFGHNALWFVDGAGVDEAYNWGVFDFNQPRFLQRFLTGDTRYWVEAYPGAPLIEYYRRADRSVVLQRLNLTVEQAQRALAYVRWNARDEHKFYRYDYFRDNCSTRVRDVIDLALNGALRRATSTTRTAFTYRSESVRLVDDLTFTQLGITTALGEPADTRLTLWQSMFIPMRMRDILRGLRVPGPNGARVPVVSSEQTIYVSRQYVERTSVPTLWIPYLVAGLLLAIEFGTVGRLQQRGAAIATIFRIEVLIWSVIAGLLGMVLLLAWTSTRHVFWYRNENLLLVNPLSLWLALLVGLSWRRPRYVRPAAIVAAVIAAMGVLALALKALPPFTQNDFATIALILPAHLAIAVSLWRGTPVTVTDQRSATLA